MAQTTALARFFAPVLPPDVETMSTGYRYPVRTDRARPPCTDLAWAGMQWFLRPDRVVHPDDPDLVRVPDPGGGRFREWIGPVLARLTPQQIEQGRTHGFWITHDTRELACVDARWRAELFPGPADDW